MTKVVLTGDWHIGAGKLPLDIIRNIAKEYWKGKSVILMGDLIDVGLEEGMQFENSLQPQEQINEVCAILKNLDVIGYCIGNHENRIFKKAGLNVYESVLGKPKHKVIVDGIEFFFSHGRSRAKDVWREHRNLLEFVDADIIALGHNHVLGYLPVRREHKLVTFIRTGTFAKDLRYAIEGLYPPSILGWVEYNTVERKVELYMAEHENKIIKL